MMGKKNSVTTMMLLSFFGYHNGSDIDQELGKVLFSARVSKVLGKCWGLINNNLKYRWLDRTSQCWRRSVLLFSSCGGLRTPGGVGRVFKRRCGR
jgi:hypothetical protein